MTKPRIAVVGSGISGLSAAWLLRKSADVTLFEADSRFGGHTHTYNVQELSSSIPVDTGFMVYNRRNYPNLLGLFAELDVSSYPTDMSFSVSLDQGDYEYAGSNLNSLFGQRSNLFKPGHWRMLRDILRFNQLAQASLDDIDDQQSLGDFIRDAELGNEFCNHYLYPMAAAIWSCPRASIKDFPAVRFLRFFANHGLLTTNDHPQWYTVEGGSQSYLQRMLTDLGPSAVANTPVSRIDRYPNSVHLYAGGQWQAFDEVVLACHSDQSLALLNNPTGTEIRALRSIPYQANRVLLHTDEDLMPQRKAVWSSWNFSGTSEITSSEADVSVTYWMNSLQRLDTDRNYFVSLNPVTEPRDESIVEEFSYDHPMFGNDSLTGQRLINGIQGRYRTWYCGAWLGYGFHEDGLKSGMNVARQLGASIPWDNTVEIQPVIRTETLDRYAA